MSDSSNGVFRYVDIYDDYVVKFPLVETQEEDNDEDIDVTPEDCLACQANELGTWKEFRNNSALCPIIEKSSHLHAIYMKRAITDGDLSTRIPYSNYTDSFYPAVQCSLRSVGVSEFCIGRIETAIGFGVALGRAFGLDINYDKFVSGLIEIYLKSKTVFYNIVEDLHIHNVGIYDNNLVVIDYAGCEPIYEYNAKEGVVYGME
jgi:hypothetical protein